MTPIQVLLVALLAGLAVLYIRFLRSRLVDRAVVVLVFSVGLLLVAIPDWSIAAAHALGVSRGVDLVIYLTLVGLGYLWLLLFARLRRLEEQLTLLARAVALGNAGVAVPEAGRGRTESS